MKPTDDQLNRALRLAEQMRERDDDPDFLARSLLYLHQRDQMLEKVLEHLELFLRFGLPVDEHMKLVRLVEEAKVQQQLDQGEDVQKLGL
ncbi:hypothetical protein [Sedimenticola thiotaurini]|uniref:Uncharacterized protein n=1 Tax=Sedimenticola thiotaurini TaxID=1543721 RepID=A0A0F7K267_9GAMM|nr:hypothetical protein [Sedimenticola thiotaurini]AKH21629.1 hypothetical protein AAY24_16095 [Sedimenticola thiotaurini]